MAPPATHAVAAHSQSRCRRSRHRRSAHHPASHSAQLAIASTEGVLGTTRTTIRSIHPTHANSPTH